MRYTHTFEAYILFDTFALFYIRMCCSNPILSGSLFFFLHSLILNLYLLSSDSSHWPPKVRQAWQHGWSLLLTWCWGRWWQVWRRRWHWHRRQGWNRKMWQPFWRWAHWHQRQSAIKVKVGACKLICFYFDLIKFYFI